MLPWHRLTRGKVGLSFDYVPLRKFLFLCVEVHLSAPCQIITLSQLSNLQDPRELEEGVI